jgi:hypothetical protein
MLEHWVYLVAEERDTIKLAMIMDLAQEEMYREAGHRAIDQTLLAIIF